MQSLRNPAQAGGNCMQLDWLKRREFITLLAWYIAGASAAA
jgi:hypothetical protein